jgi:hypothetical protein
MVGTGGRFLDHHDIELAVAVAFCQVAAQPRGDIQTDFAMLL